MGSNPSGGSEHSNETPKEFGKAQGPSVKARGRTEPRAGVLSEIKCSSIKLCLVAS